MWVELFTDDSFDGEIGWLEWEGVYASLVYLSDLYLHIWCFWWELEVW